LLCFNNLELRHQTRERSGGNDKTLFPDKYTEVKKMNQAKIVNFQNFSLSFFATAALSLLAVVLLTDCSSPQSGSQNSLTTTGAYSSPVPSDGAKTLENLRTAFNGESNAHAKYLEYARRANAEGYTKAASLFRAAARAEEIHAANHAEVIRKMGFEPKAYINLP
jgi:hypothetical protein